jgi:hypothetical protein
MLLHVWLLSCWQPLISAPPQWLTLHRLLDDLQSDELSQGLIKCLLIP